MKTDTPPGFNKQHRDLAKIMLAATSVALLAQQGSIIPIIFSSLATMFASKGTVESGKNLKWLGLSLISFVASLVSYSFIMGQDLVDEDRAYDFKIKLLVFGQLIRMIWGGILGMFVISTFTYDASKFEDVETYRTTRRYQ